MVRVGDVVKIFVEINNQTYKFEGKVLSVNEFFVTIDDIKDGIKDIAVRTIVQIDYLDERHK